MFVCKWRVLSVDSNLWRWAHRNLVGYNGEPLETCNIFHGRCFRRSGACNGSYSIEGAPYLKDVYRKGAGINQLFFC